MFALLCRLATPFMVLALSGCATCNVSQFGSGSWAFEGIVNRVFTADVEIPVDSKFRYELDFEYQQPNTSEAPDSGRYKYTSAYLDVSDDDGTVFQVEDLNGKIELAKGHGVDSMRFMSTEDSATSGGLPGHAAATGMEMAFSGNYNPIKSGPLSTDIDSSMPVYFFFREFEPGLLRVEFGYEGRFIEGEVRTFECT